MGRVFCCAVSLAGEPMSLWWVLGIIAGVLLLRLWAMSLAVKRRADQQARNEEMFLRAWIEQEEHDRNQLIDAAGRKPWQN